MCEIVEKRKENNSMPQPPPTKPETHSRGASCKNFFLAINTPEPTDKS